MASVTFEHIYKRFNKVGVVEHQGNEQLLYVVLAGQQVLAPVEARTSVRPGDEAELAFDLRRLHLFDPADDHCITARPAGPALEAHIPA